MAVLTPAQLEAFQATARLMFKEGMAVSKELPDALRRAVSGVEELIVILRSRATSAEEPELKTLLDSTTLEHAELFKKLQAAAKNLAEMPAVINAAHEESSRQRASRLARGR